MMITIIILLLLNIIGFSIIQKVIQQHNSEYNWMIWPGLTFIPILSLGLAILCVAIRSLSEGIAINYEADYEFWEYKKYKNKQFEETDESE